jgi:long-chain acyl-CoA synthetase
MVNVIRLDQLADSTQSTHAALMAFPTASEAMAEAGTWVSITNKDAYCSYLPLAHVFERGVFFCMIRGGARIGFFSGDQTKLLEDIQIIKPTIFVSVPRLLNKIYATLKNKVDSQGWIVRKLFEFAFKVSSLGVDHV